MSCPKKYPGSAQRFSWVEQMCFRRRAPRAASLSNWQVAYLIPGSIGPKTISDIPFDTLDINATLYLDDFPLAPSNNHISLQVLPSLFGRADRLDIMPVSLFSKKLA